MKEKFTFKPLNNVPFLSYTPVGSVVFSEKGQDGCPMKNVGHDPICLSSPPVCSADPPGKSPDGFWIQVLGMTEVGMDS
jgi:hypothetical protein